jgi:hypothetical protein
VSALSDSDLLASSGIACLPTYARLCTRAACKIGVQLDPAERRLRPGLHARQLAARRPRFGSCRAPADDVTHDL